MIFPHQYREKGIGGRSCLPIFFFFLAQLSVQLINFLLFKTGGAEQPLPCTFHTPAGTPLIALTTTRRSGPPRRLSISATAWKKKKNVVLPQRKHASCANRTS